MKGLLVKDFKLLWSQKQFFLVVLAIALVLFGTDQSPSFVISYLTILISLFTISTISYDEYDNGMNFLFTFPISRKNYVTEKYLLGLFLTVGALILSVIIALVFMAGKKSGLAAEELVGAVVSTLVIALGALAVTIPIQLKFGENRGRVALLIAVGCAAIIGYAIVIIMKKVKMDAVAVLDRIIEVNSAGLIAGCCIIGGLVLGLSYLISLKIMKKKQF